MHFLNISALLADSPTGSVWCNYPPLCFPPLAACHSQDRPTAAVTPIQSQQAVAFLPHLAVCPQPVGVGAAVAAGTGASPSCARAAVSLGCAAASLTPPNVSAASLEADALRPVAVLAVPVAPGGAVPIAAAMNSASAGGNQGPSCRMDKDGKVGAGLAPPTLTIIHHHHYCFKGVMWRIGGLNMAIQHSSTDCHHIACLIQCHI